MLIRVKQISFLYFKRKRSGKRKKKLIVKFFSKNTTSKSYFIENYSVPKMNFPYSFMNTPLFKGFMSSVFRTRYLLQITNRYNCLPSPIRTLMKSISPAHATVTFIWSTYNLFRSFSEWITALVALGLLTSEAMKIYYWCFIPWSSEPVLLLFGLNNDAAAFRIQNRAVICAHFSFFF